MMRNPMLSPELRLIPIPFSGEIRPGDSICDELLKALARHRIQLKPRDILVIKHKIVSKAEGRLVDLANIQPSPRSRAWARRYRLDPRVIELALTGGVRIVRRKRGVLITETSHGLICANSGVDVSNVDGGQHALLLPKDPDRSAATLHRELKNKTGASIPVIISDTFGRPWREGLTEVAIGVAGMKPLRDYRNLRDPYGYALKSSREAVADELACAAGLVCGKLARTPACLVRGFAYPPGPGSAKDLIRPAASDLVRGYSLGEGGMKMASEFTSTELETFSSLEWCEVAPTLNTDVRTALERVLESQDGSVLSPGQCTLRDHSQGASLIGVLVAANTLRRELAGNIVTYVLNRNINFTNVCFVGCKFCAFSRGPRQSDAYFLTPEEVAHKAVEAHQTGATEVCIQGGLPHGLPPFYYRDILRAIKQSVPRMHIHAFSPMEIVYGVELTGMPLADYLTMLRDNGLDTLPGTAAEILDDEIRQVLSRNKLSAEQWKQVIRAAHACGIRSTSTLMYGHRETPLHWVNQLLLLRDIQSETGGFTEFVPLGFVHHNTLLFQQGLARTGPTLAEHLKIHALARILLAGAINNIQVSWVKLNRKLSQLCLHAGANDYGGTLMEENMSRVAGADAGQYSSPEDFQTLILEAGRIPAERNTTYSRIQIKVPMERFSTEQALTEFA